jgi:hypothetical protein
MCREDCENILLCLKAVMYVKQNTAVNKLIYDNRGYGFKSSKGTRKRRKKQCA